MLIRLTLAKSVGVWLCSQALKRALAPSTSARSWVHCVSGTWAGCAAAASASWVWREMHSRWLPGVSSCCAMAKPMPLEAPVRM